MSPVAQTNAQDRIVKTVDRSADLNRWRPHVGRPDEDRLHDGAAGLKTADFLAATGALDAAAIATFCGSAVGTIAVIYDQSGAGRDATTAVTTREYRIWSGTAITTIGTSGNPFAFIDAEDRRYTFNIPTLTGTTLSAVIVGSLGNGVLVI